MKIFMMLIGLPGSGKSTYLNIVPLKSYKLLSSDALIEHWAKQEGKSYNNVFKKYVKDAHKVLNMELSVAIKNGMNIIWDQTNVDAKTRKGKIKSIPGDYHKIAVYFQPRSPEELFNNMHEFRPDKIIPLDVIRGMWERLEFPTVEEGFDEIYEVTIPQMDKLFKGE